MEPATATYDEFDRKMLELKTAVSLETFLEDFEDADFGFEVVYEDDGIGPYEFWGAKFVDRHPCVRLEGEGELVAVWAEIGTPDVPKEYTERRTVFVGDDEHDIDVDAVISMALKGEPVTETKTLTMANGATLTYTLIKATYEWCVDEGYKSL